MTTKSGIPVFFLFPFINELEYTIDLKLNKNLISIIHVFITSHLSFAKLDFHLNGFMSKWEFTVAVEAHLRSSLTLLSLLPGQPVQAAAVGTANGGHGFSSKKGTQWPQPAGPRRAGKHSADYRVGISWEVPSRHVFLHRYSHCVWGVCFVPRLSSIGLQRLCFCPDFRRDPWDSLGPQT